MMFPLRHPAVAFALLSFFPLTAEIAQRSAASPPASAAVPAASPAGTININTASRAALRAYPGIGPEYASKIIKCRPYARKEDLLLKRVLPKKVYNAIKNRVVVKTERTAIR